MEEDRFLPLNPVKEEEMIETMLDSESMKSILCVICHSVCTEPADLVCGHYNHVKCLKSWKDKKKDEILKCPECNMKIENKNLRESAMSKSFVLRSEVQCLFAPDGCNVKMTLRDEKFSGIRQHLSECKYRPRQCASCEETLMPQDISAHFVPNCINQIDCPNGCSLLSNSNSYSSSSSGSSSSSSYNDDSKTQSKIGIRQISRSKLETHLKIECPESKISCRYCPYKVKRKSLQIHMNKPKKSHVVKMLEHIELLTKEIEELQKKVSVRNWSDESINKLIDNKTMMWSRGQDGKWYSGTIDGFFGKEKILHFVFEDDENKDSGCTFNYQSEAYRLATVEEIQSLHLGNSLLSSSSSSIKIGDKMAGAYKILGANGQCFFIGEVDEIKGSQVKLKHIRSKFFPKVTPGNSYRWYHISELSSFEESSDNEDQSDLIFHHIFLRMLRHLRSAADSRSVSVIVGEST